MLLTLHTEGLMINHQAGRHECLCADPCWLAIGCAPVLGIDAATHYERVPVRWPQVQSLRCPHVHELLLVAVPVLAVDGGSGTSRGHAWSTPVMRRPGARWRVAITRPSAFQAGHIPSWRESCESYALSPVAAGRRWSLLLLSPLLSAELTSSDLSVVCGKEWAWILS